MTMTEIGKKLNKAALQAAAECDQRIVETQEGLDIFLTLKSKNLLGDRHAETSEGH